MPAEEGIGLEDEQGLLPVLAATSEEDKPEPIGLRKDGLGDLAMNAKRNALLTAKSILGDQVRLGACEIGNSTEPNRMAGRLSELQECLFK
ncbi:hypothetical protein ANRL1_03920 [Anaerolineae bacterium]|nr:hypothetical protein ANRL1_03920 [Anaerolineae bacterium]